MREQWRDRLFQASNVTVLILFSIATVFPIYYTIVLSFTDPTEYYTRPLILFPQQWTLDAYKYLLSNGLFMRLARNQRLPGDRGHGVQPDRIGRTRLCAVRKRLRFRKAIMMMILITFLFQPGLVPLYLVVRNLGLIDSVWSLILPSLTSAWYVLLMKDSSTASRTAWRKPAASTAATRSGCSGALCFPCPCRRWSPSASSSR